MNFGSIGSSLVSGIKNVGSGIVSGAKNLGTGIADRALVAANAIERLFGGSGTTSANLTQMLGMGRNTPSQTPEMMLPARNPATQLFDAVTGLAPRAIGDQFAGTRQFQTPSQSSPAATVVPPAALNATAPSVERTGRAFVPTAPPAPGAGTIPAISQPAAPVPTPATPQTVQFNTGGGVSPNIGALVSQAAILQALAQQPGRNAPSGYVTTPESLDIGARPRRKIRMAGGF